MRGLGPVQLAVQGLQVAASRSSTPLSAMS